MRIIPPSAFATQPWKNGGGITHEIAREDRPGAPYWRLSIAEVAADGPFSAFPGLSRILTVIEGGGLWLDTPDGTLAALPFQPVAFSGDLPVTSRLVDRSIRDFNLIFDGARLSGTVTPVSDYLPPCPAAPGVQHAFLILGGGAHFAAPDGSVALFEGAEVAYRGADLSGLLVRLGPAGG